MSDVFISYASSTTPQAQRVAEALRSLGYGVWRDDQLPAHLDYADVIQEQLSAAKAVVVIWSAEAVKSQWVRAEANRARKDRKLVQLKIDNCRLPLPFDQIHCADISNWSGDTNAMEWRSVLASIGALAHEDGIISRTSDDGVVAEAQLHLEPGARPTLTPPDRPSIAVLPFNAVSENTGSEYLVDGIAEDISTALSQSHWLFVISSNTSFTYRDRNVPLKRIGQELGVHYILEGSVRRRADRVRITAQLVDAEVGAHVWADRFDRELVDILSLQDEITERIVAAITPAVLQTEGLRTVKKRLSDFSALDCFYKGMWHLNKLSAKDYSSALALFRQAVDRDPQLSLGHIGLARILHGGAVHGWSPQPVADLREARVEAQAAIGLDAFDAWAYFASSGASLYLGDHETALAEARQSNNLNPSFALSQVRLGQVLIFKGQPNEAIAPIERGVRLSPYDPQLWVMLESLALANYHTRNYEQAIIHARAAMHQRFARVSILLAASLAQAGRTREAAQVLPERPTREPSSTRLIAPPYADPAQAEHLRQGVRLARLGR